MQRVTETGLSQGPLFTVLHVLEDNIVGSHFLGSQQETIPGLELVGQAQLGLGPLGLKADLSCQARFTEGKGQNLSLIQGGRVQYCEIEIKPWFLGSIHQHGQAFHAAGEPDAWTGRAAKLFQESVVAAASGYRGLGPDIRGDDLKSCPLIVVQAPDQAGTYCIGDGAGSE